MRLIIAAIAALCLAVPPASAQDLLREFGQFVEEVLPQRQAPRPAASGNGPVRPQPPVVERPVAPSVSTPVVERPSGEAEEPGDIEPPLPRPRPEEANTPAPAAETEPGTAVEVRETEVPEPEPDRIYQTACPALLSGVVVGEMLEPIAEGICGERSPLLVNAVRVNGREIGFSAPVTTNCQMAGALADWVGEVDAYAKAALDSPVEVLGTGTSLMCRDRVGGGEAFVSEHGFANALDVTGFTLADGRTIAVEADWMPASAPEGRLLRQAHGAACGRFTTVLGPEANVDHEDHLHLDLGCHGQTCTAQICE